MVQSGAQSARAGAEVRRSLYWASPMVLGAASYPTCATCGATLRDGHVTAHGKTLCREHAGEWVVYRPNAQPWSAATFDALIAADPHAEAILAAKTRVP